MADIQNQVGEGIAPQAAGGAPDGAAGGANLVNTAANEPVPGDTLANLPVDTTGPEAAAAPPPPQQTHTFPLLKSLRGDPRFG
ncbi:hypothetical protein FRC11_004819 [Ceratobasidium sp. 423]|nr:hypothetical protein FRC11_004819 [Ceratobasidium sp. 423]